MSVKLIHTSRFHGRFRLKYLDFSFLINIVSSFNLICQQWETTYIYRFLKISSLDKCLELLATLSSLTIKNLKKLEVKFRNRKKTENSSFRRTFFFKIPLSSWNFFFFFFLLWFVWFVTLRTNHTFGHIYFCQPLGRFGRNWSKISKL